LSPAVEACLIGMEEGTRSTFELPAGAAFGERNPAMQQWLSRKELNSLGEPSERYAAGEVVQFPTPDGKGQFAGVVLQVAEGQGVQFDFNHPLAGKPVTFEVQLIGIL
jgi:FKBP-type peptidyl-prolyl cis-trans isomerase SlpA